MPAPTALNPAPSPATCAPAEAATGSDTTAFYDYVRGRSEQVPPGHRAEGLRVYRHLVRLGARQLLEAHFPELPARLGEAAWTTLIEAFVRDSRWTSPFYGDLRDEFLAFLARESA